MVRRGLNEASILPLARWARDEGLVLRFIEYMDVGHGERLAAGRRRARGRDPRDDRRGAAPGARGRRTTGARWPAATGTGTGQGRSGSSRRSRARSAATAPGPGSRRRGTCTRACSRCTGTDLKGPLRDGEADAELADRIRGGVVRACRPLLGAAERGHGAAARRWRCSPSEAEPPPCPPRVAAFGSRPGSSTGRPHRCRSRGRPWPRVPHVRGQPRWPDGARAHNVGLARGGRRRPGAEAIASSPLHPVRLRSPQGQAGGTDRDRIKVRRSMVPSGASFTSAGRPARAARLGARKDVTGIPVSVLLPGVEVSGAAGSGSRPRSSAPHPDHGFPAALYARGMTDVDRSLPIPPSEQPARLAALVAAVRARTDLVPRVGIVLGSGSRQPRRRARGPGLDPVRGAARLAGGHGARARGPAAAGTPGRRPGRRAAGALPPVRGQRPRPRGPAGAPVPAARRGARDPDQRRRRREPGLRPRHADDHQRPHQPHRHDAAPGPERGRARPPLRRHDGRLGARPSGGAAGRGRGRGRRRSRRGSTPACSAPATRPRPRSACSTPSARTPSACQPCSRRSPRAGSAWRCAASRS